MRKAHPGYFYGMNLLLEQFSCELHFKRVKMLLMCSRIDFDTMFQVPKNFSIQNKVENKKFLIVNEQKRIIFFVLNFCFIFARRISSSVFK